MKVLLINGSPHEKGCTYTALAEVAGEIEKAGIETEIFHIGSAPIGGCSACNACFKTEPHRCIYDDTVNIAAEKCKTADGFVFGTPVHYAGASGSMTSFLDRLFYFGADFKYKPGAAIASCRRAGTMEAIDQLTKYFTISNMPVVASQYWPMVYGNTPEEVRQDLEGMQTMRLLGKNMAWMLQCIDAGKKAGIQIPQAEPRIKTNFIKK